MNRCRTGTASMNLSRLPTLTSVAFILLTLTLTTACSSKQPSLVEESKLARQGLETFGRGVPYMVIRIPDSVEKNPLRQEQLDAKVIDRLSTIFARGSSETVHLVIGGPSSPRAREITILSLQKAEPDALGGLVLMFSGSRKDA